MLKRCFFVSFAFLFLFIISFYLSFEKESFSTTHPIFSSIVPTKNLSIEDDLLGKFKIPKIDVNESIYSFDSDKNQVDQHVSILDGSILPSGGSDSIIFLAAHSGSGRSAYFKNLYQLKIGDLVYFSYKNIEYTYRVTKVFEEKKDGDIELSKSSNHQLVLTTCSPTHNDKQLIVDTVLIQKKRIT